MLARACVRLPRLENELSNRERQTRGLLWHRLDLPASRHTRLFSVSWTPVRTPSMAANDVAELHCVFASRLASACRAFGNPIVAGIDPRIDWLPPLIRPQNLQDPAECAQALSTFGRELIDVLAQRVPIVKFQSAFYEKHGPEGLRTLHEGLAYARQQGLIVILDAKRGDIGTTAEAYAQAYLSHQHHAPTLSHPWAADALTINAYLGSDGVTPFSEACRATGNGLFILVRTSNPSAREFQDLNCEGVPLYRHVAQHVAEWARPLVDETGYSAIGAVVGATYPDQIAELRAVMPHVVFLVPGYGAQGGTARDVAAAFDANGLGAIINNSRGLAFAYNRADLRARHGFDWQRCVEDAVTEMANDLADHTNSKRLHSGQGNTAPGG